MEAEKSKGKGPHAARALLPAGTPRRASGGPVGTLLPAGTPCRASGGPGHYMMGGAEQSDVLAQISLII